MRKVTHQALVAAPVALPTAAVAVAQTWDGAKNFIGQTAVSAWHFAVSGPLGMAAVLALLGIYFGALYMTGRDATEVQKIQEPTMPLFLACRWIARDSVWAEKYDPAFDDEWVGRVDDELMAKVLQGRIELFGKRHRHGNPSEPMQYVAPAFKSEAQWNSHNLVSQEPPTHMWQQGGDSYYDIHLDGERVKQLWPKRGLWARLFSRSPIERIGGRDYRGIFPQQDAYYRDKEPALMSAFEQLFGKARHG